MLQSSNYLNFGIKRISSILFLVIFASTIIGCTKEWFDKKSNQSLTVPSTIQDFEALLSNFDLMNSHTPGLGEIGSDGHYMPEDRYLSLSVSNSNNVQKNAYTFSNHYPYLSVTDWNSTFQRVFNCNLVIEGILKYSERNGDNKSRVREVLGNAYFLRAKNFFDLAQVYAQPYVKGSATTDLGIPIKLTTDVNELAERASVKETYDQILDDLALAIPLLPDFNSHLTKGSKAAAFALVARTYLILNEYSKAKLYADSCLNIYSTLIDLNSVDSNENNLGILNSETIFYSKMTTWPFTFSSGYVFVDTALFDLYDKSDLRRTRFFRSTPAGIAFKGMYNSNTVPFTGLATDEVYLIRAECEARLGNVRSSLHDLNHLLRFRWDNGVQYENIVSNDPEEVLRIVLLERKKELLMRGIRWSDLKRLNQDERFRATIRRKIGTDSFILEPQSYKYTLPIPQDVLNLAPKLKQSPGW